MEHDISSNDTRKVRKDVVTEEQLSYRSGIMIKHKTALL